MCRFTAQLYANFITLGLLTRPKSLLNLNDDDLLPHPLLTYIRFRSTGISRGLLMRCLKRPSGAKTKASFSDWDRSRVDRVRPIQSGSVQYSGSRLNHSINEVPILAL